ncbi:MAG: EpsG family protein [Muribaculaceae bacterium]|nr:EpsG family protein [Muribaculaceae bacterium]
MYWLVLLILLIFLSIEIKYKHIFNFSFYFAYILISLLLILRKGQGTDFYNYKELFDGISQAPNFLYAFIVGHGEIGFIFFNYIFIKLGLSFEAFMMCFSLVTMICYFPFFKKQCNKSIIPLFIFFSTFFLIYAFSAIRQGLAMAIVLSYLFPLAKEKYSLKFFVVLLIAVMFHTSAIICIFLPFVYKIRYSKTIIGILIVVFAGVSVLRINFLNYLPFINLFYKGETAGSNSIFALFIRIIALLPIFLVNKSAYLKNDELNGVKNILVMGFIIYALLSFNDLVSSRINVYYRMFEGIFVYLLIYKSNLKIIPKQIAVYYASICIVLFYFNIIGFLDQGKYKNCNVWTYPYLSVFDSDKEIRYFRSDFGANQPSTR